MIITGAILAVAALIAYLRWGRGVGARSVVVTTPPPAPPVTPSPAGTAAPTPATPTSPAPAPAPAPAATPRSYGWLGWVAVVVVIAILGLLLFRYTVTTLNHGQDFRVQPPSVFHYKNVPHTEQEISVLDFSEKHNVEKVDDSTLRIRKGGGVKFKFCIRENSSPGEVWMLNFAMYAEKAIPGEKKEVAIFQINGTSQENRLPLGWVPDHAKNKPSNLTIKPNATIGGCENEFSLDALTGPLILKGPIKVIRRR